MRRREKTNASFGWVLVGALFVASLFVCFMAYLYLDSSRQHYLDRAKTDSINIAHTLALNIEDTIEKVDISLLALKDSIGRQMVAEGINKALLNERIHHVFSRLKGLEGIRVSDKNGLITYGVKVKDRPNVSIAHQSHFIYLKNHPEADAVVTKPIFGKISKRWVIKIVRRYNYPDGAFAGVITGILDLEHFVNLFSDIDIGSKGVIVLRDGNLAMLARYPNPKGIEGIIGLKNFPDSFRKMVAERPDFGTLRVKSAYDFIDRTISYHKIGKWPLLLHVGVATDDYLSDWRGKMNMVILAVAIFMVSTGGLLWLLYRGLLKRAALMNDLEHSRQTFREFAKMSSDWFWELDADGRFVRVSSGFDSVMGEGSSRQLVGKRPWEFFDENKNSSCSGFREAVVSNEPFEDVECAFVNQSGQEKTVLVSGNPAFDGEGNLAGYRGTGKDISERKRIENELMASHMTYQNILATTMDGFFELDNSGHILDVNQAYCVLSGYSHDELLQMTMTDLDADESRQDTKQRIEKIIQKGHLTFEARHRRKDGSLWSAEISTTFMNGGGGLLHAFCKDITERKHAEEELRASKELIEAFFNNFPGLAYVKDEQNRYVVANSGYEKILGIAPESIVGKTSGDIVPRAYAEKLREDDLRILKSGVPETIEESYQGRHFQVIKFVVDDEGHHKMLCGLAFDVTEQQLLREREKALLEIRNINLDLPEHEVLNEALGIVERQIESPVSFLQLANEDQLGMERVIWSGNALETCGVLTDIHDPIFLAVISADRYRMRKPIVVNDYATYCEKKGLPEGRVPLQRFVVVPIIERGSVRALIGGANKTSDYVQSDITTLELVGELLWRMTRRKRDIEALRQSHEAYTGLLSSSPDGFLCMDCQGRLLDVNQTYCDLSGFTREELLNMNVLEIESSMSPRDVERKIRHVVHFGSSQFETRHHRKDGSEWDVEISATFHDLHGGQLFVFARDITERKQYQKVLQHLATVDDLTGISNRRHFMDVAQREYLRAMRLHQDFSIAMLDVDRFKNINDEHGHDAGDKVLSVLASVFLQHVREIDLFARFGGDEFALLLPGANSEQALAVVERARQALLQTPLSLGEVELFITVSVGIASVSEEVGSLDSLIKKADDALYESKKSGRDRITIDA